MYKINSSVYQFQEKSLCEIENWLNCLFDIILRIHQFMGSKDKLEFFLLDYFENSSNNVRVKFLFVPVGLLWEINACA